VSEEWGPWIDHDGRGCPCVGEMVQAYFRSSITGRVWLYETVAVAGSMGGYSWDWINKHYSLIIRYRIRKPKGLKILEGLLENLPNEVEVA